MRDLTTRSKRRSFYPCGGYELWWREGRGAESGSVRSAWGRHLVRYGHSSLLRNDGHGRQLVQVFAQVIYMKQIVYSRHDVERQAFQHPRIAFKDGLPDILNYITSMDAVLLVRAKWKECSKKFSTLKSNFTLLHWILHISRVVCGRPGNRCFKQRRRLSARSASNSLFSASVTSSLTISHDDLELDRLVLFTGLELIFLLNTWIDASTRFAISIAWCSDAKSRQSRRYSGENWSDDIYRYIRSPRVALPFWKEKKKEHQWLSRLKLLWRSFYRT